MNKISSKDCVNKIDADQGAIESALASTCPRSAHELLSLRLADLRREKGKMMNPRRGDR